MRQSSIIDIITPIMVGPSSSHTAGAVRLGLLARNVYDGTFKKVTLKLYNSYANTGKGHGTDKGLLAGILGLKLDDKRIKNIFDMDISKQIEYKFEYLDDFGRHPNAVDFIFEGDLNMIIQGESVGAGEVAIRKIDDFSVKLTGKYNTLLIVYKDIPHMISRVTDLININIASLHCDRSGKGHEASMCVCLDGDLDEKVLETVKGFSDNYLVRYINKLDD